MGTYYCVSFWNKIFVRSSDKRFMLSKTFHSLLFTVCSVFCQKHHQSILYL